MNLGRIGSFELIGANPSITGPTINPGVFISPGISRSHLGQMNCIIILGDSKSFSVKCLATFRLCVTTFLNSLPKAQSCHPGVANASYCKEITLHKAWEMITAYLIDSIQHRVQHSCMITGTKVIYCHLGKIHFEDLSATAKITVLLCDGDFILQYGAGDGNRTHVASLEGWDSTIELHPQFSLWSERQDSNLRPPGPKPGALPS